MHLRLMLVRVFVPCFCHADGAYPQEVVVVDYSHNANLSSVVLQSSLDSLAVRACRSARLTCRCFAELLSCLSLLPTGGTLLNAPGSLRCL